MHTGRYAEISASTQNSIVIDKGRVRWAGGRENVKQLLLTHAWSSHNSSRDEKYFLTFAEEVSISVYFFNSIWSHKAGDVILIS